MKIDNNDEQLLLHLQGTLLNFRSVPEIFSGVIKKGLRLVLWGNSEKRYTSCVFISELDMRNREKASTEIIILSGKSIDKEIVENDIYSIGIPGTKIADFKVNKILGKWNGKVPQISHSN